MQFKAGQRVKAIGFQFMTGVPEGTVGTVTQGVGHKNVYTDPNKKLVRVTWDDQNLPVQGYYKVDLEAA